MQLFNGRKDKQNSWIIDVFLENLSNSTVNKGRLNSPPSGATFWIILAKLQPWYCEVQLSPWSSVDFSLELSSANLRAIARQIRCRCLAMLSHAGHEQPPHGLGRRHDLRFCMMRKFVLRSTLCAFDMSPMEKKQEKLRLWNIGLTENKKGTLVRRLRWKLNRKRTVIRGLRCEIN